MFLDKLLGKQKPPTAAELQEMQRQQSFQEGMSSIRDMIAPSSFELAFDHLKIGDTFTRTLFVYEYPRFLDSSWLSPVVNIDIMLDLSIFIYPQNTEEVAKKLRAKSTQIESSMVMEAEKGLTRNPFLEATYSDIENLRDNLVTGQSKMFKQGMYITLYEESLDKLNECTKIVENMFGTQLVFTKHANLQMEQGLNSTLPMGKDELTVSRNMDTEAVSASFPFVSSTLTNNEGILYGANKVNNSLIIFDRFKLQNYNSVVLGVSGGGKSYATKLELLRQLMFDADIIVIDPEKEFQSLCEAVGGTYANIHLNSKDVINPFDLPQNLTDYTEQRDSLRSNVIALTGLLRTMMGKLSDEESNVLDKALAETYAVKGITEDPKTHRLAPPLMSDLQHVLESIPGGESMALRLQKFTEGTFSGLFNDYSNISLANRFVCFCIRDLEEDLRPIAMYSVLNFIWNKVKSERKKRILVVDEAWVLMKYEDSAQFLYSIAKRGRKYYLGLTTIGQDIGDFLKSEYGKPLISNAALALLLKQHPSQVDLMQEVFDLTAPEKNFLLQCSTGEGIFIAGMNHAIVQIICSMKEDSLVTTNPEQLKRMAEQKAENEEA
ncbi:MAG: ATP-binding protein [bacterium]|nr:ATP-binding protein [bacterium]